METRIIDLFAAPQMQDSGKPGKKFLQLLKEYFEAKASKGLSNSTIEKHGYFYSNVFDFFHVKGIQNHTIADIRVGIMEEMRVWLHADANRTGEHVSRHIQHCIAAMDHAVLTEEILFNPLLAIKAIREKPGEVVSLTSLEVRKIMNYRHHSKTRQIVADLFLLQCFTGLSYIDLWQHEIMEVEKKEMVAGARGKNNKRYWAEYNEYARAIRNKYNGELPIVACQVYNRTLQMIARTLGIEKHLTSHVGRKTYATLKWERGQSLESIAVELGNTPQIVRARYVTEGPQRVLREAERLSNMPLLR